MVSMMSKIIQYKLNGSIDKDDHLVNNPPIDETNQVLLRYDPQLFLQIQNLIESDVIALINHCVFVKELMNYLDFLYFGKGNISWMYEAL
ncbi:hypothetical protein V6Z11_D13G105600 [Gossypium hirsutum]